MSDILTIAGSPSIASRSAAVLGYARERLESKGLSTSSIHMRDFNAEALLTADVNDATIAEGIERVAHARAVIISTPVYKAAYTGVLKAFLDVLPQGALAGKVVLPVATAASASHYLVLDYTLKPVLAALNAGMLLAGLYIRDSKLLQSEGKFISFDEETKAEFDTALDEVASLLARQEKVATEH